MDDSKVKFQGDLGMDYRGSHVEHLGPGAEHRVSRSSYDKHAYV